MKHEVLCRPSYSLLGLSTKRSKSAAVGAARPDEVTVAPAPRGRDSHSVARRRRPCLVGACPDSRAGRRKGRCAVFGVLLSLTFFHGSCALPVQSDAFLPGRPVGILRHDGLREVSGIVASRRNPGVLWVHNDSGDAPRVFAINAKAECLGACRIAGARSRDWEDIAVGPGPDPNRPYLYIGDIGDNRGARSCITVYRVPEPTVRAAEPFGTMTTGPADAIQLTYPDRPRDAETLLVDPWTRDIYIISKREFLSKVYRAAYPQSTTKRTPMERVTVLPWGLAVAGDVSPDGRRVIVKGLFNASLWNRSANEPLWKVFAGKQTFLPLANESQGEALCFDARGTGYFTIAERVHPPLYYFGPAKPDPSPRP